MANLEADFSTLLLSIGSSASIALGQTPAPGSEDLQVDLNMAAFNIDLLLVLQKKTQGNLSADEQQFLQALISDLQTAYVSAKHKHATT